MIWNWKWKKILFSISSKYSYLKPVFNYTIKGLWKGTLICRICDTLVCFHLGVNEFPPYPSEIQDFLMKYLPINKFSPIFQCSLSGNHMWFKELVANYLGLLT
jgi:hypothetical protein